MAKCLVQSHRGPNSEDLCTWFKPFPVTVHKFLNGALNVGFRTGVQEGRQCNMHRIRGAVHRMSVHLSLRGQSHVMSKQLRWARSMWELSMTQSKRRWPLNTAEVKGTKPQESKIHVWLFTPWKLNYHCLLLNRNLTGKRNSWLTHILHTVYMYYIRYLYNKARTKKTLKESKRRENIFTVVYAYLLNKNHMLVDPQFKPQLFRGHLHKEA